MEIKNKIAVWCALFALLVALVPTSSVRANAAETTADDVKYRDIEGFMHSMGYTDFTMTNDGIAFVFLNGTYLEVFEYCGFSDYQPYFCREKDGTTMYFLSTRASNATGVVINYYKYYEPQEASKLNVYSCIKQSTAPHDSGKCSNDYVYYYGSKLFSYYYLHGIESLLYCDVDVFESENIGASDPKFEKNYDVLLFESSLEDNYSFPSWCQDAGLNCLASSNESSTKIPYSYNSYWHIVRKTSSGKWLLTTVGNSVSQENASDYTFMYSEDMGTLQALNLYSGEDANGYLLNVRQYEYDTDGWKVRTYETYDARETDDCIIDLGAGSGVDDTRVLAYTNVDIYDQNFELVTSASTEYTEPITPESPSEEITPTPTTIPSGDTSDRNPTPGRTEMDVDLGVDLDNITLDEMPEVIKNIKDSIKGFFGLVGVVPLMIGAVFGFLPDWCIWVLGVSFAFVGVLLVIKLIRG